ncbi:MAG: hypothetical protein IJ422_03645 [Oscillospiraceae bacterium]|nr:hypothetical protein [Oscillospiraceae bacterium]
MKRFKQLTAFILTAALVLSSVFVGAVPVSAAGVDTYIASCTAYNSYLTVRTTTATALMTYPCSSATQSASSQVAKVTADTMLTVTALYKNTAGEYWYKVTHYGEVCYVKAADTTLVDQLTGDVTATNLFSPASLGVGDVFPIGGTITASINALGSVTVSMYHGSDITKVPAITASDTASSNTYTLDASAIDYALAFNELSEDEYTYVVSAEAISYYVDSNDTLATSTRTVILERKNCIINDIASSSNTTAFGIDVSYAQGTIDWSKASQDIDFSIIRASYEYTTDKYFYQNANGCTQYGVPFGVYVYSYAESVDEAVAEAEYVLSLVEGYDLALPIFFDYEDTEYLVDVPNKLEICKAFCQTIEEAGYQPGIYSMLSWFDSYFGDYYFDTLPKWVAHLSSSCGYTEGVRMWQYSWTGSISGISTNVDCNYYYGEFPGQSNDTSYLAQCTYYPSNLTVKTTGSTNIRQYPSTSYSTLTTAAASTSLHVTGLYKNTSGEYWYQVETSSGTGYLLATLATVTDYLYDDIAVIDPAMASNLSSGAAYPISGVLASQYNRMNKVCAKIYSGENTLANPVLSSSAAADAKEYNLYYSDVDYGLAFNDLSDGYYTYEISADVVNYYVSTSGSLTNKTENVVVWVSPFTVGSSTISHSHTPVSGASKVPTCTEAGYSAYSYCSECGEITSEQTTIPATGHTPGETVIENETETSYDEVIYCTTCGAEMSRTTVENDTPTPVVSIAGASLSMEDEILYNIYISVENLEAAATDVGLLVWDSTPEDVSNFDGAQVYEGAVVSGSYFKVTTDSVSAKHMGDMKYFVAYVKLNDGSYVFSEELEYSVISYALNMLANSDDADLKKLCVALLNYGAAAQEYFAAKTDYSYSTLMNVDLTPEQQALIDAYSADMLNEVTPATSDKVGALDSTGGYGSKTASITLGSNFSINYRFAPTQTVDSGMTMYYWSAEDYASADVLTAGNCTGSVEMVKQIDGSYTASYTGIPAKLVDETVYVCGLYTSSGQTYSTGVIAYSLGAYLEQVAGNGSTTAQELAQATAVYCYYAKNYFANRT